MIRALRRLIDGLRRLAGGARANQDLDDELDAFAEAAAEHHRQQGLSADDAQRAARLALGSHAAVKDHVRDVAWESVVEDAGRDLAYGWRCLRRQPGFTAAAVLTLGLGIGLATAVFSVVNTVLVQPLPYADARRLVRVVERAAPAVADAPLLRRISMRWPELVDWRARSATLSALAFSITPPITLMSSDDGAIRLSGALVSTNLFSMLGATAAIGRTLDARDDAAAADVVVLSASAWQRYFGGRADIVGQRVSLKTMGPEAGFLDGRALTVIGVMPARFDYPEPYVDYWAPIGTDSPIRAWPGSGTVIGRLADGVSVAAATDEANAIGDALRPRPTSGPLSRPLPPGVRRFDVEGVEEQLLAASRPAFHALSLAVGVLLLITCANVAGMLLARGAGRQREIAVRLALGAGRGRVVRQLLAETLVLAGVGGACGAVIAIGTIRLLRMLASTNAPGSFRISWRAAVIPRLHEVSVDATVLAVAAALAVIAAIVAGVAPSLAAVRRRRGHGPNLAHDGRQQGAAGGASRFHDGLVVVQVALATVLLVAAGLLALSFGKIVREDPGWDAADLLSFYLVMPQEYGADRKAQLVERVVDELHALPGVAAAGFTYAGPLLGLVDQFGVFVPPGRSADEMRGNPDNPQLRSVSHHYLQAMGATLVAGRWLDARDDGAAPPVLLVNRTVVQRVFGGRNPVGELVHLDGRLDLPPQRIVGVVEDMRHARLDEAAAPQMFVDYRQVLALTRTRQMPPPAQERLSFGFYAFFVRSAEPMDRLMPTVRRLLQRVDRNVGIDAMAPMSTLVTASLTRQRFYASVMAVFAAVAAALSAVGIYGVLAYGVARRTQEIGVRMALGAEVEAIRRMVLRRGLTVFAVGAVAGLGGAVTVTRYLAGMLYHVTPLDPWTYALATAVFGVVAALACWAPARRATRVDPMTALRCD